MSFPQGLPRPELRGHIPPGGTRAEPPRDRLQHLPVITPPPPPAALIRGQHRLDQLPQLISDHTSSDHSPIIGGATRDLWETRPRRRTRAPLRQAAPAVAGQIVTRRVEAGCPRPE